MLAALLAGMSSPAAADIDVPPPRTFKLERWELTCSSLFGSQKRCDAVRELSDGYLYIMFEGEKTSFAVGRSCDGRWVFSSRAIGGEIRSQAQLAARFTAPFPPGGGCPVPRVEHGIAVEAAEIVALLTNSPL
jgi:hypothetical protein